MSGTLPVAGDLNGEGHADLVFIAGTDEVTVQSLRGRGDGTSDDPLPTRVMPALGATGAGEFGGVAQTSGA